MLTPEADLQASPDLLAAPARPGSRRLAGAGLALAAVAVGGVAVAGAARSWPQVQAALEAPQRAEEILAAVRGTAADVERLRAAQDGADASRSALASRLDLLAASQASLVAEGRAQAVRFETGLEKLAAQQAGLVAQGRETATQTLASLAALDQRLGRMELRLTRADEPPAPRIDGDAPGARADKVLNRFGIVRVDGNAAWVVGPEGWFHVGVGDKLPGDVTVLEIGALGGRRALITDKGVVFPAGRE